MLKKRPLYLGETLIPAYPTDTIGEYVNLYGETYYRIQNYDAMPPFFMSIVSSADHWLFIASTGGMTAGRGHEDNALFPYYTEDKLTENGEYTGSKTILRITRGVQTWLWEPFSIRQQGLYLVQRNLYKNIPGTSLIFEEINHSLDLVYRYAWRTSDRFGFVKTGWLENTSRMNAPCDIELLDGLQNILPANVSASTQNLLSCLLDAYKRSEIDTGSGLGIFTLNSRVTDLAEPSESLLATSVFQVGLTPLVFLLSSSQLDSFRLGGKIQPEHEVRGQRGAYFVLANLNLEAGEKTTWHIVADVHQDHSSLARISTLLNSSVITQCQDIEQDIAFNNFNLEKIVASADGLQVSQNLLASAHHFANVLFNTMRGGVFANQYWIDKVDLIDYLEAHQRGITQDQGEFFATMPPRLTVNELKTRITEKIPPTLRRLLYTYLPLTFSRRHGDPSRPWNRFSINIKNPDGSERLDYEGNWRDIFQNWEALVYSYPEYIDAMIGTFLTATTADGYNPYRISRKGIDWEIPEEGNPWANIGYWSDHQIIYLEKLMEASARLTPGALNSLLNQPLWQYANVPYRIKPYAEILKDPHNTIVFDHSLQKQIEIDERVLGVDARLLPCADGTPLHATLTEKLLTLLLAKLVNFIPDGGIWMNTQRPEWNDANNALVGHGLSVVTLGYLRRFLNFFRDLIQPENGDFEIHAEVAALFESIASILQRFQPLVVAGFTPAKRRDMMDALGEAGSEYRWNFYEQGFSGATSHIQTSALQAFLALAQDFIENSLRANRRPDALYHAYNILRLDSDGAYIDRLDEMLEGQVSILSSGLLGAEESLALLQSLRKSALYRPDQHTYILYPDKALPSFLQKNSIHPDKIRHLKLPWVLAQNQETTLLIQDINGNFHFSGSIHNARAVMRALEDLKRHREYAPLVEAETKAVLTLFEDLFCHAEFTGRSGTFFAYEGLGSIYWHMVSKLLLAVQETAQRFENTPSATGLRAAYYEIRAGLGYRKSPAEYGAFPTDPYSHTPAWNGARQPGMTGIVKEEILTRQAEVSLTFESGQLVFNPFLVDEMELLNEPRDFTYLDVTGEQQTLMLVSGSLTSFVCQTPITVQFGDSDEITIYFSDETSQTIVGRSLGVEFSKRIFARDGIIRNILVSLKRDTE